MQAADAGAGGGAGGADGRDGQDGQGLRAGGGAAASAAGGAPRVTRVQHASGPGVDAASTARRLESRLHMLYPTRGDSGEWAGGCLRRGVELQGTNGSVSSLGAERGAGGGWGWEWSGGRRNESRGVRGGWGGLGPRVVWTGWKQS